jgi:hypothetical protein
MSTQNNYVNNVRGWPRHPRPTYYVKKRRTVDRKANDGLAEFQFIASRRPLVREWGFDPTEMLDPDGSDGYDQRNHRAKQNRNRFRTDLGSIYCESSTMKRLALHETHSRECGIEKTLVTLCHRDTTEINFNGVLTLNLDNEFNHHVQDPGLADSARHIKQMIRDQCIHLVKIDMQVANLQKTEQGARQYLRGAQLANFQDVIVRQAGCLNNLNGLEWMVYETRDLLDDDNVFREVYDNTLNVWYLCSRRLTFAERRRIQKHLI